MMLKTRKSPAVRAALLLALLLALCAVGRAEEARTTPPPPRYILDISLSSRPAALVSAGDITLSFSISNRSEYDVQNVYLTSSDGLHSEPLGQVPAGDSQTINRTYTVTEAELEAGQISFILSHDAVGGSGEQVNYTVSTPIERSIAAPMAEFTSQLSSDCASKGGTVTVTYRVRNTGNVPLTQLRVTDPLGDFIGRVEALGVGETRVLLSRVTVSRPTVSQPALNYTVPAEEGKSYSNVLEERAIFIAEPELSASFAADTAMAREGDSVTLTLMLRNLGNADYRHITVYDAVYGGVIASSLTLPAGGEPLMISRVYPVRGDGVYQFRVEAVCQTGERVTLETERLTVPMERAEAAGELELTAQARTPKIRAAGGVTFDLYLSAVDAGGARHVRLSEQSRGFIRSFEIVPPGEPMRAQATYQVNETDEFDFLAEWTDAGGTHIVRALPVTVEITPEGEAPESAGEERPGLFQGVSVRLGEASVYVYLIAGGCLVLAGLIVALYVTSRKERRARRERQDQQRRKKDDLGRTNRFVPVKRPAARRGGHPRKDEPPKS